MKSCRYLLSYSKQIWGLEVRGQSHWQRKCKKVVAHAYLRQKWVALRQTKTKMINEQNRGIQSFHEQKCFLVVILCNLFREGLMYPLRPVADAVHPDLELSGGGRRGLNPPPQFVSTDAHFWVKIGHKLQSLGKVSHISAADPPVLIVLLFSLN